MRITLFFYLCTEQKPNKMDIRRIIFLLLTVSFTFSLPAQNIDINTLKTINKWKVHGLSRGLSASGVILPVGVPAAMGLYALIKKDQPMLKDAVYIGTSVIEAVGITYAAKHIIGRDRPFVKYPDKIHAYGAPDADSPSFPSGHTAAAFFPGNFAFYHLSQMVCHRSFCRMGLWSGVCTNEPRSALSQ